jgi:hypothetical protein
VGTFDLLLGPVDWPGEATVEDIELVWMLRRDEVMAGPHGRGDGTRPWAWWAFEAGEERPDGDREPVRLAELGELTAEELAALREEANEARLRIGTESERISGGWRKYGVSLDQQAVDLWETVESTVSPPA